MSLNSFNFFCPSIYSDIVCKLATLTIKKMIPLRLKINVGKGSARIIIPYNTYTTIIKVEDTKSKRFHRRSESVMQYFASMLLEVVSRKEQ